MKRITRLLIIIAVMLMTVTPVYAGGLGGNGSEGKGYEPTGGYGDRAQSFKDWSGEMSGYRLYIIDNATGFISESMTETDGIKVIDLVFGDVPTSDITIKEGTRYPYYGDYDVAYRRVRCNDIVDNLRSMPRPIVGPGIIPNGIGFKAWMISTNSATGKANGLDLISDLFGEDTLKKFIENDMSLVVETIVWGEEPYMDENWVTGEKLWVASGKWLYGTVYDWANWFSLKGWDFDTLDSSGAVQYLSPIYGAGACNSLVLSDTVGSMEGWVQYGNKKLVIPKNVDGTIKSVFEAINYGYGIHIYSAEDIALDIDNKASINTYDDALGTKIGKSPLPTKLRNIIIVKRYETVDKEGNTLDIEGTYIRFRNPVNIIVNDETDKTGYTVRDIKISSDKNYNKLINMIRYKELPVDENPMLIGSSWSDLTVGCTSFGVTTLNDTVINNISGKVLYVLLVKQEEEEETTEPEPESESSDIIVSESYIQKRADVSEIEDLEIEYSASEFEAKCGGHVAEEKTTVEGCDGHGKSSYEEWGKPSNVEWKGDVWFHVPADKSGHTVERVTKTTDYDKWGKFSDNEISVKTKLTDTGVPSASLIIDYVFNSKEKTLDRTADEKPNDKNKVSKDELVYGDMTMTVVASRESVDPVSITPNLSAVANRGSNGSVVKETSVTITDNSDDLDMKYVPTDKVDSGCSDITVTYSSEGDKEVDFDVTIKTYGGKSKVSTQTSGSYKASNTDLITTSFIQVDGTSVRLIPWVQMQYDTMDSVRNTILIPSAYERTMQVQDFASVYYAKTSENNIQLESSQWSTHAGAKGTNIDPEQKGYVLPGGAIIDIVTNNGNNEIISVETCQMVLENCPQLSVSTDKTYALARTNHSGLVADVEEQLSKLKIAQYVNGEKVEAGGEFNGLTLNTDSKYYLRDSGSEASQLNGLDVLEGNTTEVEYVFSTDCNGNLLMNGSVILRKNQTVKDLTDSVAKEINNKTNVISYLLSAVERNTGNDVDALWSVGSNSVADGKWYNEQVSEIKVLKSVTRIQVGFIDVPVRGCVVDPKLCPIKTGVSDMWTQSYESYFKSDATGVQNVTFEGKTLNLVGKFSNLYRSNNFYIPDVNVQDLLNN